MLAKPPHEQLQFIERHILTPAYMDKHSIGIVKKTSSIKKRTNQGVLKRLLCTILTMGNT